MPNRKARNNNRNRINDNNISLNNSSPTLNVNPNNSAITPIMPQLSPISNNQTTNTNFNTSAVCIAPFDGTPEHIDFFCQQLVDYATILKWPDQFLVTFAKSKLAGKALQYVMQAQEAEPITSSHDLFNRLKTFFKSSSVVSHIHEFESLCMLSGETIPNLAHRITLAARRVYPNISEEFLQQVKYTKFIKAIPDEIRLAILTSNVTTFQSAVEKAIFVQQCNTQNRLLSENKPTKTTEVINALVPQINSIKSSVDELSNNNPCKSRFYNKRRFHNRFRNSRNRSFNQHKSNYNHKHIQFNRHNNPLRNSQASTSNNSNSTNTIAQAPIPDDKPTCQLCLCFGHSARNCTLATFILQQQQISSTIPNNSTTASTSAPAQHLNY